MKKKVLQNTVCGLSVLALTLMPCSAFALTQDETVYAKLKSDGQVDYLSVTEHLLNDEKMGKLVAPNALMNVENLNGFEGFVLENNNLVWDAQGKDIYYSGEAKEELPVAVEVTYYLNGEEKSLEEMLGKSGKVEIRLHYTNSSKVGDLYTPFVAAVATTLPEEQTRNVEVSNGKAISNGRTIAVTALAAPGLYDSLKLDELKSLDDVVIKYETENFELMDIYSVVTPKVLDSNDLKIFSELDGLYAGADELSDGSRALVEGTNALRDGIAKLREAVVGARGQLANMGSLLDEATLNKISETAAATARKQVAAQQSTIRAQIHKQVAGMAGGIDADGIANSLQQSSQKVGTKYVTQLMTKYLSENPELMPAYGAIQDGTATEKCAAGDPICADIMTIQAKQKEYTELVSGIVGETMAPVEQTLGGLSASFDTDAIEEKLFQSTYSAMRDVAGTTAAETARSVATQVADSLAKGVSEKLVTVMDSMISGIDELLAGADELTAGMQKFDREGIQTLNDFVNNKVKGTANKLERLAELADQYKSYAGLPEGADGETKFVLMIDGKKRK